MMNFIMLTLSFMVALLLSSGLTFILVFNKKILKWYMKRVNRIVEEVTDELTDEFFDKNEES